MPKMTGGEAAVQALLAQGVDTLFVLPGVQNDALFSALYDAAERLRVVVTRHEQAAGYMAYGYAAASGRPGAYCVVPGPGDQDAAGSETSGGEDLCCGADEQCPSVGLGEWSQPCEYSLVAGSGSGEQPPGDRCKADNEDSRGPRDHP